jgi:predicted ATPase
VDWRPEGVCALVGPNASGKTTLLDVPTMVGDVLRHGISAAFDGHGGLEAVRTLGTADRAPLELDVSLGDLRWEMRLSQTVDGLQAEERAFLGDEVIGTCETTTGRPMVPLGAARLLATAPALKPLGDLLTRYRLYRDYDVGDLRRRGSDVSSERRLDGDGANVFSVLGNWRRRPADTHRFDFVVGGLREMFPSFFEGLELVQAARVVGADLRFRPDGRRISAALAPQGWFGGLLHLAAVASTDPDDVIAIDAPERSLHPRGINVLIERFRAWSRQHRVTVLLGTQSPVLLDTFRATPEQVYIMEPGGETLPIALTEQRERSWLSRFALGELYAHDEFGAPSVQ